MAENILDCTIESGIGDEMPDSLVVQLYGNGDEDLDTSVGGNAIVIDDDHIGGEYSIYDVDANPSAFCVERHEAGYWIHKKDE